MVNEFCFVSGQPPSQPILCQNPYPWTYPERYGLYQSRLYSLFGSSESSDRLSELPWGPLVPVSYLLSVEIERALRHVPVVLTA